MMQRATQVLPAGGWPPEQTIDTVTLPLDDRHRRRWRLTSDGGRDVLLDLAETVVLRQGDGLQLEDGQVIAVRAADEELLAITAATPALLMRVAWHIGNRHLPAEIQDGRVLIRADHVIADMVRGLGAVATPVQAPFTPEAGAYAGGGHGHHHHDHGHDHDHHGHGHHHHHDHD